MMVVEFVNSWILVAGDLRTKKGKSKTNHRIVRDLQVACINWDIEYEAGEDEKYG